MLVAAMQRENRGRHETRPRPVPERHDRPARGLNRAAAAPATIPAKEHLRTPALSAVRSTWPDLDDVDSIGPACGSCPQARSRRGAAFLRPWPREAVPAAAVRRVL